MGTQLANAYVQIIPSAEGMMDHIKSSIETSGNDAGASFGLGLSAKAKAVIAAAGIATSLTVAAKKGIDELKKAISETAEYGDNIDKMSQKIGLSAEAYQEWDAIMQHSGTSIDAMQSSMKTLASAAETGKAAFDELGISEAQIASMNQEELFSATIAALQNVESDTKRTYLAGQLLGKGATELGALLNTSAEDTETMRRRVHELGGVMSDEAVKAAAAYQDNLQDMQTAIAGIKRGFAEDLLPSVNETMSGITEIFTGNTKEGVQLVKDGMTGIVNSIGEALPDVISKALSIGKGIFFAILESVPDMLDAGFTLIENLANGIGESADEENAPSIISSIGRCISKLLETIIKHLPQLVSAGVKLVVKLASGLVQAIPSVVAAVPEIIGTMITSFKDFLPSLVQLGKDLIASVINGITQKVKDLGEAVKNAAQSALDKAKDFLGINSPSRVFQNIVGKNIGLGIAKGIEITGIDIEKMLDKVVSYEPDIDYTEKVQDKATGNSRYAKAYNAIKRSGTLSADSYSSHNAEYEKIAENVIKTITEIGTAVIKAIAEKETPSVYINDRDIFAAAARGARLYGASLIGV